MSQQANIEIYSMSNFHCGPMSILHWLILVYFHRCCRLLKAMFCVGCWLSPGRFLSSDEQIAIGILQLEDIILHSDRILYGKTISPESRSQLQPTIETDRLHYTLPRSIKNEEIHITNSSTQNRNLYTADENNEDIRRNIHNIFTSTFNYVPFKTSP